MSHKREPQRDIRSGAKQKATRPEVKNSEPSGTQSLHAAVLRAGVDPGSLTPDDVLRLQRNLGNRAVTQLLAGGMRGSTPTQKVNRTGLPAGLKEGVEALSGVSMEDVQVHYNSPRPAALQALAFTQGTDIHLAPGQERHLAHEAWHVIQQKRASVQPTARVAGSDINDDSRLEREADVMGARATSATAARGNASAADISNSLSQAPGAKVAPENAGSPVIQRRIIITPNAYASGLGVEVAALTDEQIMEYLFIAVRDDLKRANDLAASEAMNKSYPAEKRNAAKKQVQDWNKAWDDIKKAKSAAGKVELINALVVSVNDYLERNDITWEADYTGPGKGSELVMPNRSTRYATTPTLGYEHTSLTTRKPEKTKWGSDERMYEQFGADMADAIKDKTEGKALGTAPARGVNNLPLLQLPWDVAKAVLPRPLMNLIFDVRFQLEMDNAVVVDERTPSEKGRKKTTPSAPGTLRSWHQDSPEVLPDNTLIKLKKGASPVVPPHATALHRHYSDTSESGAGSSITTPFTAPQGYAEYTGTGSNSEHNTKVVLDYVQKRVYLTLTHYQYWAVIETGGKSRIWASGTQKFEDAEGKLSREFSGSEGSAVVRSAIWMSPWMEILMPSGKGTPSAPKTPPTADPPSGVTSISITPTVGTSSPEVTSPTVTGASTTVVPSQPESTPKPPEPKGERVTSTLRGGPDGGQQLAVCSTVGDGSCGIHAMLGAVNPLTGQYQHAATGDVRQQIAERIRGGHANAVRYRKMLTELLRAVFVKVAAGKVLAADELLLWTEFKKVEGLADELRDVYAEETEKFAALSARRNRIVEGYLADIKSASAVYAPLRAVLVNEILISNSPAHAEARRQLEALEGADARAGALRLMPDIFLSGLIENSLQKLAKRWRSDTTLWGEYGAFRGAHHRADLAARLNFSNVVGDYFDRLLAAYATVVESDDYYLREEDLRELAEIQGRGLDIYRQHDTEGGAFIEQVSHPGPDPFKVFHSGAHYERARMT